MRASHRSALHQTVFVAGEGTDNLIAFAGIAARGGNVHPVAIVGIVCTLVVSTYGCDYIHTFVIGAVRLSGIIVACGKYDKTARHRTHLVAFFVKAGIVGEVIHGCLERRRSGAGNGRAPAVLRNDGSVVAAPYYGFSAGALFCAIENLAGHDLDSGHLLFGIASGYAAHANAVVVHCSDSACNVGSVVTGIDGERTVCKIVSETVVALLLLVDPHVVGEVLVVEIHALVHHTYDDVGIAGLIVLPYRENVDVASTHGR